MVKNINTISQELSEDDLNKVSGGVSDNESSELEKRIISIICEQLDIPSSLFNPYSNIRNEYGLDSLDLIDLTQALEEEFKISIDDTLPLFLVTAKDIVNYIADRVNPK